MLQEFTVKNFKSIKDEASLNFEAIGDYENESIFKMPDGVRLLRFMVVLGANASGKSNLLEALEWMRLFWTNIPISASEGTGIVPFLLQPNAWTMPSEFDLYFYSKGLRYHYTLTATSMKVIEEKLWVYISSRPTRIFTRKNDSDGLHIDVNPSIKKLSPTEQDILRANCLDNMSLFSTMQKVNVPIPYVEDVRKWIASSWQPKMKHDTNLSDYTRHMISQNPSLKQYLLNFVHEADFNINDITVRGNEVTLTHNIATEDGIESYTLPDSMQSAGTTRMIEMETIIYNLINTDGFLIIDEIEASMHPSLIDFILTQFLTIPKSASQLLVSSHYDPILDGVDDLFGKDSVWFTEKLPNGNTSLYSLIEFKGLNTLKSIRAAYRSGMFGAKPNLYI